MEAAAAAAAAAAARRRAEEEAAAEEVVAVVEAVEPRVEAARASQGCSQTGSRLLWWRVMLRKPIEL